MRLFCVVLILFSTTLLSLPGQADSIIVNEAVSEAEVSPQFLLSVFAMRTRRWSDGQLIHVFVLPDSHPTHVHFVKSSLQVFPYQLRNLWDQRMFSGAGVVPMVVRSEAEMIQRVRMFKGAIGYISREVSGEQGIRALDVH